ncbi:MAG: PilZ domain-containing protein [Spirochaetales bacterium]|nr:PilZ domain-containing protein [Spirochaetales bacterium]
MREKHRRTLYYYLKVYENSESEPLGFLADITTEGCLLLTEQPLRVDSQLKLKVALPRGGGMEENNLEFSSVVRWVRREENRSLYSSGLSFTDKNESRDLVIEKLINHIGFSDGLKKIHLYRGDADFH